ncbi:MAG: hypothetical protein AB3N09_08895 [Tateyamaria sp.]
MKRTAALCALAALLVACGDGNPFTTTTTVTTDTVSASDPGTSDPGTDSDTSSTAVPEDILGDLNSLSFNASTNTLTVTGLTQDGVPLVNEYRHITSTFAPGYETFTAQNDALGRHATAFVASRDGVQAGIVLTGPQFNEFFGGSYYERTGDYVAPTAPESRFDVTYYGNYAGGLNGAGPVTDLITPAGLDPDVGVPAQAAYITGLMFVNVDLNDMSVEGEIYDRTAFLDGSNLDLPDLVLIEGELTGNGTFAGNIEIDESDPAGPGGSSTDIGDFAGIIGGPNGETMAGGTFIERFSPDIDGEIEYGVFVLDLCEAGNTDPICVAALTP